MVENPQRVRKSFLWKSILWLLPVAGLVFYTLYATLGEEAIFIFIFPLVFGSAGISMMMSQKKWLAKLPGLLFIGAAMMPLFIMQQQGINFKEFIMGPTGVMLVVIGAFIFTYKKIGKYTQKGAYASKHLLGLKEFIKHVKQDEIKRRLDMDPLYLEKMLPYAVLFNEAKHWLSFYDILNVKTPYWYHGSIHNMSNFSSSVSGASTSPNSSGGSGFSGGGGSSRGGGGGGSW